MPENTGLNRRKRSRKTGKEAEKTQNQHKMPLFKQNMFFFATFAESCNRHGRFGASEATVRCNTVRRCVFLLIISKNSCIFATAVTVTAVTRNIWI
jgi:hypothetical protein